MKVLFISILLSFCATAIKAQVTYTQTNTSGVTDVFSCDGTTTSVPGRIDKLMSQVLPAGTYNNVNQTIDASATEIGFSLISPNNITAGTSGTWTVRLDIASATSFVTWDAACIFWVDSTGTTNKGSIGSSTGLAKSIGATGVQSTTVSGASFTPLAADKVYIEYVFINSLGSSRVFGIAPDSTISAPITSPTPTISSIAVSPSVFTISAGGLQPQLNAVATYSDSEQGNINGTASWTSSATSVATVLAGLITGLTAGSSTITATQNAVNGTSAATVTVGCPPQDIYGGFTQAPSPNGGSGYFRVELNQAGHWVMVSPLGNRMWLSSVYGVNRTDAGINYANAVAAKYSSTTQWATFQLQRMKQYCLNAISIYADDSSSASVYPYSTFNNGGGNSVKMPFLLFPNFAVCTAVSASAPKNLYANMNSAVYSTARQFPDVFDPAWASCIAGRFSLGTPGDFTPPISQTAAYMVGIWPDDGDNLFGFGATHPHLGWICASVAPTEAGFNDTNVYCKSKLVTFLQNIYGAGATGVTALNASWGSSYTTWGSAGGWPKKTTSGTGFLDEDGSSAWIGTGTSGPITGANAGVVTDLNLYLFQVANQYATTVYSASKTAYPNHLVIGPQGPANNTFSQVLAAFEKTMDVLELSPIPASASGAGYLANPCNVAITYGYTCKPQLSWTVLDAAGDSEATTAFWTGSTTGTCNITGGAVGQGDYTLQTLRGTCYGQFLDLMWGATANNGIKPIIGVEWWEWPDKTTGGENTNFGFVSQRDNPYGFGLDGNGSNCSEIQGSVIISDCTETSSHGDFITGALTENNKVMNQLIQQPSAVNVGHLP